MEDIVSLTESALLERVGGSRVSRVCVLASRCPCSSVQGKQLKVVLLTSGISHLCLMVVMEMKMKDVGDRGPGEPVGR